jgi:hypothetical protein
MKKVFRHSAEVAHIWAQQNQPEGRTPTGHCFFENKFIWSYGKHYCLGAILTNKKGEKIALLNEDSSSPTTNGQRGDVRSAVSHYRKLYTTHSILYLLFSYRYAPVADFKAALIRDVATYTTRALISAAKSASNRRKPSLIESDINGGLWVFNQGVDLLAFYGLKPDKKTVKLAALIQGNHAQVIAQNSAMVAREKKAREKAAKIEKAEKEKLALAMLNQWRNNEFLDYKEQYAFRCLPFTALRVMADGENVETSKGAYFPVSHALKAFPHIRECKEQSQGVKANNHAMKLGSYHIDEVFANGDVKAGCHFVTWAEIELIARQLKVFP